MMNLLWAPPARLCQDSWKWPQGRIIVKNPWPPIASTINYPTSWLRQTWHRIRTLPLQLSPLQRQRLPHQLTLSFLLPISTIILLSLPPCPLKLSFIPSSPTMPNLIPIPTPTFSPPLKISRWDITLHSINQSISLPNLLLLLLFRGYLLSFPIPSPISFSHTPQIFTTFSSLHRCDATKYSFFLSDIWSRQ